MKCRDLNLLHPQSMFRMRCLQFVCFFVIRICHQKTLTRGRTDHFSNALGDRKITQPMLLIYSVEFKSAFLYYKFSALATIDIMNINVSMLATSRSAIPAVAEFLFPAPHERP